jgi:hypothetical protein
MSDKTLSELIARKMAEGLSRNAASYGLEESTPTWVNMSEAARGLRIAAAAEIIEEMGLLGLHVHLSAKGSLTALPRGQRPAAAPPPATPASPEKDKQEAHARRKASGYTGNFCSECCSDRMVRNGSCEKCENCGATSGCS